MEKAAINTEEVDEDPVESMLKKTGCLEKHYSVAECIAETKDWRKCQDVVTEFRLCMETHNNNKKKNTANTLQTKPV